MQETQIQTEGRLMKLEAELFATKRKVKRLQILILPGLAAMALASAYAFSPHAKELECTSLRVLNEEGRTVVHLKGDEEGGMASIMANDGLPAGGLFVGKNGGGMMSLYSTKGGSRVSAFVSTDDFGVVRTTDPEGKVTAKMP